MYSVNPQACNPDRERLLKVFGELSESFARAEREVKGFQNALEERVKVFSKQAAEPVYAKIKDEASLAKLFSAVKNGFCKDCQQWADAIKQTAKSISFREKLNDSMLVYVYGKVKSGKSSLGNFVAYGNHDPSPDLIARSAPVRFDVEALSDSAEPDEARKIRDQQNSTRKEHKFLVDFKEATACIQYFRMPGLTWIDSPGIHSTTAANGELARQYLESADLVVYTTTSRSAMQEADRLELLAIAGHRGKPFVLVSTRCDEEDEDVDASDNIVSVTVMMPDRERKEIAQWCAKSMGDELAKKGFNRDLVDAESVITLSCKYAGEHLDDEGWTKSGMPEFYGKLVEIAQANGVSFKKNAPLKLILSHIATIQKGLASHKVDLDNVQGKLDEQKRSVERKCSQLVSQCGWEVRKRIGELAEQDKGDNVRFKKDADKAVVAIAKDAMDELCLVFAKEATEFVRSMPVSVCNAELKDFEDILQTVSYKTTGKRTIGAVVGAILGGVAGFFLSAGGGAVAGASVGAEVGRTVGEHFDGSETTKVKVGDNTLDVVQDAACKYQIYVEERLHAFANVLTSETMGPLEKWIENMKQAMDDFSGFLAGQKSNISKEISQ